jgi:hypothetical protein
MSDAIGPRQVCRLTCNGCPALKTDDWTEYLENDETDSGSRARCSSAGDKVIDSYWHESRPVPKWCPAGVTGPDGESFPLSGTAASSAEGGGQ